MSAAIRPATAADTPGIVRVIRAVYDEYGYTPHRVRRNEYGLVKEQWTNPEYGLVFVFDQCNTLLETHEIEVEKRRTWQYQRDVAGYDEAVCCDDE